MSTMVTNATLFTGNPYHQLLYGGLEGQYEAVRGTIDDAVGRTRRKESELLHVHWEENPLRKCATLTEARLVTDRLCASLNEFKYHNGKLAWTLHNRLPHELEFIDELMQLRQALADTADRILVHSTAALATLREQVNVDYSKFLLFPHPSYAGIYPRFEGEPLSRSRTDLLFFGLLREYKGLDLLMQAIGNPAEIAPGLTLRVRGDVLPNDPYKDTVDSYIGRPGIDVKIGRVPDEAIEPMFSMAQAVVMPYERFLTSGVAMLALTFGTPVIAPDTPQMRELLPPENADLLYTVGDADSLRQKIAQITHMPDVEYAALCAANLKRADIYHPDLISRELGRFYTELQGKSA